MRFSLFIFLIFTALSSAQNNYPQDYFSNPLEIPLILSGTFAELRSNHFHSGLDIKTQQRVGLKVKAIANGYVSRIKVSHYGYGKALYITHPNGYTSVYGHLQKFAPEIEAYIKKHQYEKESYQIELFPSAETLPVSKDSLVAYSGNSGGSGGPHLHFEIRDKAERPMNPMLFGIDIKDDIAPVIKSIYAYPLDDNAFINKSNTKQKLNLIPLQNGDYVIKNIEAYGNIGFGIETIDRQNLAANSNGVYNIQTFVNGNRNFEIDFKKFSFAETRHLNQLIDYEIYTTKKRRIQKLFKKNNPLSLLKPVINNGVLNIEDSTYSVYKIKVADYKNNASWVTINIKGSKNSITETTAKKITPYFIKTDQAVNLKEENIAVDFYKDTFYDDFYLDFDVKNDTLTLHKNTIAAKKSFNITFDISKYNEEDKQKLYIARLVGYKKYPTYSTTKRKENLLTTNTKILGTYTLARDTIKPTITPINFKNGQWLSKYRYLKIKINDTGSGISNYRATVNGKWILMEYDYKTKTLTHDFNDNVITDTKNNLKVILTDNVGNNSTFEALFYRK
ncbi:M23 family metallopeptidase [Thalassobellus sediminis]|uniref:M23 family metallopeptidase n=1 Tax=Thalassobellus sediminis TaxID=3367753 RepID=UPI0037877DF3